MIKKESLPNLAGPTQILPVNVRGPALILKTGDEKIKQMKKEGIIILRGIKIYVSTYV